MFSWTVPLKKERSPAWYSAAAIASLSLVVWGFVEGIYALPVVVIVFMGVFLLLENNSPDTAEVTVSENGVGIGSEFFDYPKIASFAIVYDSGKPVTLRLRLNKGSLRSVDIEFPSGTENVSELRAFLAGYATEAKDTELTTLERVSRGLGM